MICDSRDPIEGTVMGRGGVWEGEGCGKGSGGKGSGGRSGSAGVVVRVGSLWMAVPSIATSVYTLMNKEKQRTLRRCKKLVSEQKTKEHEKA